MTAIVAVAVRYGLLPSLFASVVASLCCFLPAADLRSPSPIRPTLRHSRFHRDGGPGLGIAARVRTQAMAAIERARTTGRCTRSVASSPASVRDTVGDRLSDGADAESPGRAAARERDDCGGPATPQDTLDDADLAAARWAWEHNRPAGQGPPCRGQAAISTDAHPARRDGIVGIDSDNRVAGTPDQRHQLDALIRARWRSGGFSWSRTSIGLSAAWKPIDCARHC
jgi:two-component system sensor histidine kinase KdpD